MQCETFNRISLTEKEVEILKKAKELLGEIRENAENGSIMNTNIIAADDALHEILYTDECIWSQHSIFPRGW